MSDLKKIEIRLLFILMFLIVFLIVFFVLVNKTYSAYEIRKDVSINVVKSLYVFEEGRMNFNIDLDKLVPSDEPYIYMFDIANYNDSEHSDVDIEYRISMRTTTNLPLRFELYRNNYEEHANNIFTNTEYVQDNDFTWYNKMEVNDTYYLNYDEDNKDTYYLVVYFPLASANVLAYSNLIDNIEISIESKQVLDSD